MFKKFFTLLFFVSISSVRLVAQDFYDTGQIQEIKLYFSQPNWRTLLNTAAASAAEPYTLARRVVINGTAFDSVGAKFKGNSSFRTTNVKNPLHIELDYVKNQDYKGYKDIKLSNVFADPTFVREALSYDLMQSYTHLPRANFAKVWVNDTLIGLYTNTEAITKSFCKKHYYSGNFNVFVKGTPPSLGVAGAASSLVYLGTDTTRYQTSYEIASTYGWTQLTHLCDTLNNNTAQIEKILDVDRSLWMLAFNSLFVNLDSYTGIFTQNYYLWRDDNRRFNPIIWDLNMSFGAFNAAGVGGSDSLSLAKLIPFAHETNTAKPLISKLLANPRFKKMYRAHLKTMNTEAFRSGKYLTRATQMQSVIDAAVQQDPNKFFTYTQFKTNLYYGLTGGGGPGGAPGIVSLMTNRMNYLDTLADMRLVAPVITNVTSTSNVRINDSVYVTARVTGNTTGGVLIGYRNIVHNIFTRVAMFDDGQHRDGAANDGVFGYGFKLLTPTIQYYIWAENANAGIFSPERAEHEFHNINAVMGGSDVVINEIMSTNYSAVRDNGGDYDDWIELHNKSNAAVNIGGWYLSDNPYKHAKWRIPTGTSIPANGYLIVWADEDSVQNNATNFHASFKLSAVGETITLTNTDTATVVDFVTFGQQYSNLSYARRPNGTGNFAVLTPTFAANNNTATSSTAEILTATDVNIFPNPVGSQGVTVRINSPEKVDLKVFNMLGQLIYQDTIQEEKQIETQNWQTGQYIFRIGNVIKKVVIQQ